MRASTEEQAFLPATARELARRGWEQVDVVLVTGDAYVDHPSFGVALIGRWLEAHGYRVALLAQPRHDRMDDFQRFGRPRLFFGITAGNLDSAVANYSGNGRVRDRDDYSPGGNPYFGGEAERKERRRPDRATIQYANLARAAFPGVPVVLGGIEASLRRFVHYDFQQQRLRGSVLTDAKADLLVYGMGERAVLEVAHRLERGEGLGGIAGTCQRLTERQLAESSLTDPLLLPSWQEIQEDVSRFLSAELAVDSHARSGSGQVVAQRQQAAWVIQHPPAAPLATAELDALARLPFVRKPHPDAGEVPAYRMIRDSITIVRGCCGNCSFCAITRHQGAVVVSRSQESVVAEARQLASQPDFHGTVSDLGGPTANLFGVSCASPTPCRRRDCLFPKVCRFLRVDEQAFLDLLEAVSRVEGVRHVFVSSGLRMELLLKTPRLLRELLLRHTPGALKIAPEHTETEVLRLMHKPEAGVLTEFLAQCRKIAAREGVRFTCTPYLISAHPGCETGHMERMAARLRELGLAVRQFQDFTPTPGTISTAMFVTGLDRDNGRPIPVARRDTERRAQRAVLEGERPAGKGKEGGSRGKRRPAHGRGALNNRGK
ncbi:MAG: YgiQ family radical SAM protein [Thermodesulfobacteriota bacterium]